MAAESKGIVLHKLDQGSARSTATVIRRPDSGLVLRFELGFLFQKVLVYGVWGHGSIGKVLINQAWAQIPQYPHKESEAEVPLYSWRLGV